MDEVRQAGDRGVSLGRAGVAAVGRGPQQHVRLALFKHAEHGEIAGNPFDGLGDDAAALVHHQEGPDPAFFHLRHQLGAAVPRPFLRAGGGQVNVVFRDIALRQQLLYGLEKRHHRALGVGGSAAPDLAVRDVAGKGRMNPFPLRRDHVLVAHQDQGLLRGLSLPEIKEVPVDLGLFQALVHQGKKLLQHPVELEELFPLVRIRDGNGIDPHHLGELFRVGHRPVRVRRGNVVRTLFRP